MIQTNPELTRAAVQRNCHISDAQHASKYTLCVYLLKMREYYRWEKGYPYTAMMPKDEVGHWLSEREHLWETLEEEPFAPIPVAEQELDPFDTEAINDRLIPEGYVYSGGIGQKATPHFFFGRLEDLVESEGFRILIAAEEYARDLTSPPAMALGDTIFIRRESVKRMLWEKVQEWRWHRYDNAMARALTFYDFDNDMERSLEAMTNHEIKSVCQHEIGEVKVGKMLGCAWEKMLTSFPRCRAEIMARAVRDLLADSLTTLPKLVETNNLASLHFYMANLVAMRKDLSPGLAQAYARWGETNDLEPIARIAKQGQSHWLTVAQQMLDLHAVHGSEECIPHIEDLIEHSRL